VGTRERRPSTIKSLKMPNGSSLCFDFFQALRYHRYQLLRPAISFPRILAPRHNGFHGERPNATLFAVTVSLLHSYPLAPH
jgi:hypothetical protein